MRLFWLVATVVTIGACGGTVSGSSAGGGDQTCPFRVVRARDPKPADRPHEQEHPLLRDAESRVVPGPGSLRAVVQSDSLHHPHVYIEDSSTGTKRYLIRGSSPRWSPDGKHLACRVWKSKQKPWMLALVDVATGRTLEPSIGCAAMNFAWSPNGKHIAVEGPIHGSSRRGLCRVAFPSLATAMLDTLSVMSNYHFSWSPDSRYLVADRATKLDRHEEVVASDLWIFEEDLRKCRLVGTSSFVETEPRWVDGATIRYLRQSADKDVVGETEDRVLELVPVGRRAGKKSGGPS